MDQTSPTVDQSVSSSTTTSVSVDPSLSVDPTLPPLKKCLPDDAKQFIPNEESDASGELSLSHSEETLDAGLSLNDIGKPILLVGIPIVITLMLVCAFVSMTCSHQPEICHQGSLQYSVPLAVEQEGQSLGSKATNAALISLWVVATVAIMTFVMVLVFYFNLSWCMLGYVMLFISTLLSVFTLILLRSILIAFNTAFDWFTTGFITWNIAASALFLFVFLDSPKVVRQAYLIYIACLVSLHFITFFSPVTTWFLLVALVLWDLFAVLAPCGPLRCIIEMIQKRAKNKEPMMKFPEVMIYSTMLYWFNMSSQNGTNKSKHEDKSNKGEDTQDRHQHEKAPKTQGRYHKMSSEFRPQLGMGDFVFYSLLVGKTWVISHRLLTVLFVSLSVLIGLFSTLLLLMLTKKALPALPISLTLALVVLLVSNYFVEPFSNKLNVHMIYI